MEAHRIIARAVEDIIAVAVDGGRSRNEGRIIDNGYVHPVVVVRGQIFIDILRLAGKHDRFERGALHFANGDLERKFQRNRPLVYPTHVLVRAQNKGYLFYAHVKHFNFARVGNGNAVYFHGKMVFDRVPVGNNEALFIARVRQNGCAEHGFGNGNRHICGIEARGKLEFGLRRGIELNVIRKFRLHG